MHRGILIFLNNAGQLYRRMLVPVQEETGLTQAELDILLFLANNPEYDTASDIVSVRRLAKSNVSVGIRKLEQKGLLLRRLDARDRRIEHLELTSAAAGAVELGRKSQEAFGAALVQGFTFEERRELERLMGRIHQNLEQMWDETKRNGRQTGGENDGG